MATAVNTFNRFLQGGAPIGLGLAAAGLTGPLAPIAVLGGLVGGALGLFDDPEAERERRKKEARKAIVESYRAAREAVLKDIATASGKEQAYAMQAAGRGAAAGRKDVGAIQAVVQQQYAGKSADAMKQASGSLHAQEAQALADLDTEFAGRPIAPGLTETLLQYGAAASDMYQRNEYLKQRRALLEKEYPEPPYGVRTKAHNEALMRNTPEEQRRLNALQNEIRYGVGGFEKSKILDFDETIPITRGSTK